MVDGVETLARIIMRRPEVQLTFVASGLLLSLVVLAVARRGHWSSLRTAAGVLAGFAVAVLPATSIR